MSTPSLQSQVAAVKIAADRALALAKTAGLHGYHAHLLKRQLEAAALTLSSLLVEGRDGRL